MSAPFDTGKLKQKADKHPKGVQAYAMQNKKSPHETSIRHFVPIDPLLTKDTAPERKKLGNASAVSKLNSDPKYVWMKYAMEHNADNRYLPIVYDIDILKDSTGRLLPKYGVQSLISFDDIPTEAVEGMIENLLPNLKFPPRKEYSSDKKYKNRILEMLCIYLESEVKSRRSVFKDIELLEVLHAIGDLLKQNTNFMLDLHPGNIMARLSNQGVQLVITDPLYTFGSRDFTV